MWCCYPRSCGHSSQGCTLKHLRVGLFLIWHYQMCHFIFWVLRSLYMLKCCPSFHHTCMSTLHTNGVFFVCTFNLLCTSYTDFKTYVEMSNCYIQMLCISASKDTSSSFCTAFIRFHVQTFKPLSNSSILKGMKVTCFLRHDKTILRCLSF